MKIFQRILNRKAPQHARWVEPDALAQMLRGELPPLVVDVRSPAEFNGPLGHIQSSENIPLDELPGALSQLVQAGKPVVFVCHTDRRSSAAAEQLLRAGGIDIMVARGGMVAWRSTM